MEEAAGREVDAFNLAPERIEQLRKDRRTGAVAGIEGDTKPALANCVHVENGKTENAIDVVLNGALIAGDHAKFVPRDAGNTAPDKGAHRRRFLVIEEQSRGTDELQRIPLNRVVTGRNRQSTRGMQVFDRELKSRRWRHVEIDDGGPH